MIPLAEANGFVYCRPMRPYLLILCLLANQLVLAQANFSAVWTFDNTTGGSSSHPNISVDGADLVGVNVPALATAVYATGVNGRAINILSWSQTGGGCNFGEYVAVTVAPQNGQRMTLTSISFFVNHSVSDAGNTGPQSVRVRSSLNGYGSDLVQRSVSTNFQNVNVSLGNEYRNLSGPVTFRIHACQPNGGGALRLDQLVINGTVTVTPLSVSLLYFRAQPQSTTVDRANRVILSWATTWERDADRFEIQRGRDLTEFGTIGTLPARGTTDSRQLYDFADDWPDGGTSYYRLRQVDRDGTATYSNVVAAVLDDQTPSLSVLEPDMPGSIRVRGRNLTGVTFSVVSSLGQVMPVRVVSESDGAFLLEGSLPAGLYVVRAGVEGKWLAQRALVR